MNKKGITSVCMAFAGGQGAHAESHGTKFREGVLEKKVHMEKEKKKRCRMMRSQKIRTILCFYFC